MKNFVCTQKILKSKWSFCYKFLVKTEIHIFRFKSMVNVQMKYIF